MRGRFRPRWRMRTLMGIVALAAVAALGVRPLWTYWFHSPWRFVRYQVPGAVGGAVTLKFDTRDPTLAAELARMEAQLASQKVPYAVSRGTSENP